MSRGKTLDMRQSGNWEPELTGSPRPVKRLLLFALRWSILQTGAEVACSDLDVKNNSEHTNENHGRSTTFEADGRVKNHCHDSG